MIVVSDSSPLITLARIRCFDLLPRLYGTVSISADVHEEVTVAGAGMPGAFQTDTADWIKVWPVRNWAGSAGASVDTRLGAGELSSVALARELRADLVLIDEWRARRYAREQGLAVIGCVGILEHMYEQGHLKDLREAYGGLIAEKARIDTATLQFSLGKFGLPPL